MTSKSDQLCAACLQFLYLRESFCPSLDEKISVLYEVRFWPGVLQVGSRAP